MLAICISIFIIVHNGGNMKSWALFNTNLSIYYAVYLLLKCSYLLLSAQFYILRVVCSYLLITGSIDLGI